MAQSILESLPEQTFTADTIKRMYGLIDRAKTDAQFQKFVYALVNGSMKGQWKNYRQELQTVLNWYKKNVDYRRDPYGVELLQDVWSTLDRARGDCDDATVWMGAAAEILGSPVRIVTVSTRPDKEPSHVYAEAFIKGRWLGVDATVPASTVGWAPARVTDKKIWTRKELGLAGGEDLEGIEGLGMIGNGYGSEADFGTMTPVSEKLAPGIPDDISHTYGAPRPGPSTISQRRYWRAPIANVSDWTSNPRPGGGVYGPALPIKSMPTPAELWYLVDRKYVPKVLDPNSAWWGKVPTSKEDLNRMFPGSEGTMANYLKDIASVPASAIAEIEDDVRQQLAVGEIGLGEIGDAIQENLEGYALGLPPRMKRPPGLRKPRKGGHGKLKSAAAAMPQLHDRRYLVPAPGRRLVAKGGHLNGLGDAITDAVNAIASDVQSGNVPPSQINSLVNGAVAAITGQAPAATPTSPSAASVAKVGIPIGMVALLGLAAYFMSGSGSGTRKYKRNPSRRRSRGGRRGGGFDMKTALMWGGGGLAAYFLLLRPGAPLMPAALTAAKPAAPAGTSAGTQAAIASAVKAAPSIFDSVMKLFGGGSSTPTTTAPGASPSGFVTDYSQIMPSTQEQTQSQFVTDISQVA